MLTLLSPPPSFPSQDDPHRRVPASSRSSGPRRENRLEMFAVESQELVKKTQDYLDAFQRKHEAEIKAQEMGGQAALDLAQDPARRRLSTEEAESKLFQQATDADLEAIRPMFDILWYPSLATFSVLLEENEGKTIDYAATATGHNSSSHHFRIIELCLEGYRAAIRLSSALNIETSRLAFVTSLRKFTLLGSTRELRPSSIEAIKMLLLISATEGNHLADSWIDVLQCISELERLHLFASSRPIADVFQSSPLRTRESDSVNSQHVNKIDASSIDRVFTSSAHLDSDAIVDFVKALRKVSEQELSNVSAPRVFSLQKIVEITYYNMGRIRVVWSKIWSVLSAYFIRAGCHPNLNVSMYAIDSLRQLATKFLEKDELAHYMFQKQFFKPFELIMLNNTSNETRELIVQCMHRMVASRVTNIKSGWKGVFVVIHTAASQTYQPLVVAGFELLTIIMDQHFHLLTSTTDTTDELIRCLVAFGCCNLTAISLKAIYYINQCCDHLGAQQVLRREKIAARQTQAENHLSIDPAADPLSTPSRSRGTSVTRDQELSVSVPSSPAVGPAAATMGPEEELDIGLLSPTSSASATASTMQVDLKIWFLALTGLSRMVLDPRLEVRSRALLALFKILASHGSHFSPSTWRAVFCGVLFPIFDDVRHAGDSRGKRPGTAGGSGQTGSGAERRDGSNSGESTPTREDGSSAVFSIASSHRSGGWAPHHASPWRNPSNWSWPAGALTPRQSSRPSPLTQSAATVVNEPNQRREPLTPTPSGLASVTTAQAVQVPSATATPTQVTRAIPQLPPKPPQNPSAANNPRLPTIPAPVPSVVQQKQQQASRPAVQAVTPENSWLQTTCFSALSTLVELFDHFYSSVSFMLPDLLSLIHSCISQESSEDLAKIGIKCLIMLITKSGAKLSVSAWWTALESIAEIVQRTMPLELMTPKLRGILGLPDLEPQAHVPHTAEDKPSDVPAAESSSTSNSRAGSRAGSRRNSASLAAGPSATTAAAVAIAAAGAQPSTNGLNGSADAAEPTAASATPVISIDAVPGGAPLTVNARAPSPLTVPSPSPQPLPGMPASPATQARAAGVSLSPLPPPNSSVPSSLPFSSSVVVGKFRVQLQLLEAVWQVADGFFPVKPSEKAREKNAKAGGRKHQQQTSQVIEKPGELDFLSGNGASASPTDASSAAVTQRMHSSEEIVLGHLTCEQLFFTLDLLSSSLSFARAFNLNLVLRRKLYSFGFQTEQTLLGRLPQLFLQETRATRLLMQLMLRLVQEGGDGESEQHEKEAMNGERWQAMQAAGGWEEETHANGATPIQSSYEAYVRLAEARSIGIALRFLADYVSKTVSGQLVSLEFSEELLGSFLDNLHSIARVSPTRFSNYMSIFYFPLVQLISFGKESIRQHLGLLFQLAMPSTLSFQPITPYPLQRVVPPVLPPVGTDSTPFPGHAPQSTSSAPTTAGAAH
jgi:hypothetical protein